MIKFKPRHLVLALLLSLIPLAALAEEDERTWYNVEIIVFEQREAGGRDAERWHPVEEPPQAEQRVRLRSVRDPDGTHAYTELPASELQLVPLYRHLQRAAEYRPLLHLGWRQQGLSRQDAAAVAIPPEWESEPSEQQAPSAASWETDLRAAHQGPPLYGYVRLYRERFLHVAVDLRYHRQDEDAAIRYPYLEGQQPVFAMREQRRMRSNELHYLDHPVLGVLVQVTPIETPARR
jgi:hypothetical protein